MAGDSIDLGMPSGCGVWVDRSPARRVSDADDRPGDPARRAPGDGHLLAGPENAPPHASLSTSAAHDIVMPQVWGCLAEEAKQAFGNRFSQIVVRVLHGLRTAEVA